MNPPVVPMSRGRLLKDYTEDDDGPLQPTRRRDSFQHGIPCGFDVDGTMSSPPRGTRFEQHDGHAAALHTQGPEQVDSYRNGSLTSNGTYHDHLQNGRAQVQEDLRKLDFNLDIVNENTSYAPSVTSTTRSHNAETQSTVLSNSSGSRLPDFFSNEVFQIVLHNPLTSHRLLQFSRSRLCAENMEYLAAIDHYQNLLNEVAKSLFDVHKTFLGTQSASPINLPDHVMAKLQKDLKISLSSTLPKLESVFVDSQSDIESLVAHDIYPRFVRHQVTMAATKALANNRSKFAGLGDCFVLTDPAKADNPIVWASDGFVNVTKYSRNEIIPRNCRFLQGRHTDRGSVKRLRKAIEAREENVELLLNERKDGEPFWNLLYTTPLRDAKGDVIFFLGGQINCSTTVHSQSDILRILAMTEGQAEEESQNATQIPTATEQRPRYSRFLSSLRGKQNGTALAKPTPGMETGLLDKLENMNLKSQVCPPPSEHRVQF
jgi:phototropin